MKPTRTPGAVRHLTTLELRADDLPKGVCGVVQGVALVYGVTDSYDTQFKPGCVDRTKREKLAAGKVALFLDHSYGVRTHVGVVRAMQTVGETEVMTAHIFDTEDGRSAKEYLSAVLQANAQTGLSIGFFARETGWIDGPSGGDRIFQFQEIELEEVSITPRPAVPGAQITGVRSETASDDGYTALMRGTFAVLGAEKFRALVRAIDPEGADASNASSADSDASHSEDSDAGTRTDSGAPATATMDERLFALRQSYV